MLFIRTFILLTRAQFSWSLKDSISKYHHIGEKNFTRELEEYTSTLRSCMVGRMSSQGLSLREHWKSHLARNEQNTGNRPPSLQVLPSHLTGGTTPVNVYEEPTYQLKG